MLQLTDENGRNITNPYQESAKIQFSQISVLDNDNNVQLIDNNVESNTYFESLLDIYKRLSSHIKEKTKQCGTFDIMCLLKRTEEKKNDNSNAKPHGTVTKPSGGFIDIDNALDAGDETLSRKVRAVKGGGNARPISTMTNDDEDYMATEDSSGEIEGSGEIHGDHHHHSKVKHVEGGSDVQHYTTRPVTSGHSPGQPREYKHALNQNLKPFGEKIS